MMLSNSNKRYIFFILILIIIFLFVKDYDRVVKICLGLIYDVFYLVNSFFDYLSDIIKNFVVK